jgi:hypothetical protein
VTAKLKAELEADSEHFDTFGVFYPSLELLLLLEVFCSIRFNYRGLPTVAKPPQLISLVLSLSLGTWQRALSEPGLQGYELI